jgi:Tfp pilus assembly protein PilX
MKKFLLQQMKKRASPRRSNAKAGFAMLFTVLVISIILSIALGISDLTFKQTILSNLAKDSQLAFYQADSGIECGMYYNLHQGQLPRGTTVDGANNTGQAPTSFLCGANTISLVGAPQSYPDHFVYQEDIADSSPCYSVTFDKTGPVDIVSARGFSTCKSSPRQVERGLKVQY